MPVIYGFESIRGSERFELTAEDCQRRMSTSDRHSRRADTPLSTHLRRSAIIQRTGSKTKERWIFDMPPDAEARPDAEAEADVAAGRVAPYERVREWLKRLARPNSAILTECYRASVQLSHKPRTQVLEGRPSRCLGQGRPWASIPLRVSRAPSAGTSTVHIP